MNKRNKTGLALLTLALGLAACSDSGSKSDSGKKGEKVVREHYEFELNGCTTKPQTFLGVNPVTVLREMCDALLDDERNGGCAEGLRENYFRERCEGTGVAWNPRYAPKPVPRPEPVRGTRQESSPDIDNRDRAARGLEGFADSVRFAEGLTPVEKIQAEELSQEILDCGLEAGGSRCLNQGPMRLVDSHLLKTGENERTLINFVRTPGQTLALVASMEIPALRADKVRILRLIREPKDRDVHAWLADASASKLLVTAVMTRDSFATALQRLQNPDNLRAFYYSISYLHAESLRQNSYRSLEKEIAQAIEKNLRILVNSTNTAYQERMLSGVIESYPVSAAKKTEIYEAFLAGSDKTFRELAATRLLAMNGKRVELKPIVLTALGSDRSSHRREAIAALGRADSLTASEKNAILSLLKEEDYYVREAVKKVADQFQLDISNISPLKEALASELSGVRVVALQLLDRIPGDAAAELVIGKMTDEDYYVREAAQKQMQSRGIQVSQLDLLIPQLKNDLSSVRLKAVEMLSTLQGEKVGLALIGAVEDSDYYVREKIWSNLQSRTLGAAEVVALTDVLHSALSSNRQNAVKLLSKSNNKPVILALIEKMADSDYYVRSLVLQTLQSKNLDASYIEALRKPLEGDFTDSRKTAAQLLGRIGTGPALAILRERLKVDLDYYVRQEIEKILKAKK